MSDMSNRIMRLWKVYGVILSGVFKYISSVVDKLIFVLDCLILRILSQSIIDIDCILKIYREWNRKKQQRYHLFIYITPSYSYPIVQETKSSHQCMGIGNAITIGGVALGYITTKICAKYTTLNVTEKNVGYNKSSQEQRGR